jgi:hypothetical protein
MAGALPFSFKLDKCFLSTTYYILLFFFGIGSFLDIAIKEQRVNLRVGGIMRLATEANVDFG